MTEKFASKDKTDPAVRGSFHLTKSWPSIFFVGLTQHQHHLPPAMKKILILSMLIPLTVICSCQKQDSVTEQQLAQRKTELDARETALDEREKDLSLRETALRERENALAKSGKAATSARTIPPVPQSQDTIRDAAQAKAERDSRIQQLPPEIRALIPDPSQVNAARVEKDRMAQERLAQRPHRPEQLQNQKRKSEVFGGAVFPAPDTASPTPSPSVDAASPTQSPTPQ